MAGAFLSFCNGGPTRSIPPEYCWLEVENACMYISVIFGLDLVCDMLNNACVFLDFSAQTGTLDLKMGGCVAHTFVTLLIMNNY